MVLWRLVCARTVRDQGRSPDRSRGGQFSKLVRTWRWQCDVKRHVGVGEERSYFMDNCTTGLLFSAPCCGRIDTSCFPAGSFLGPKSGLNIRTFWSSGQRNCARNPGAKMGPIFDRKLIFLANAVEATATWRWNAFLRAQCPGGKRNVYVNMDETCIIMCPESSRGLVYVKRGRKKKHVLETERRATLSMRRSACSLVAFTSSCREVGSLLPLHHVVFQGLQHVVLHGLHHVGFSACGGDAFESSPGVCASGVPF